MHYEDRAVSHLLAVACGLDSMVVGEGQILGQVRSALKFAAEHGTVGRVAAASSAGSRCGPASGPGPRPGSTGPASAWSAVAVELRRARPRLRAGSGAEALAGRDVLIVGAGSMSALAAATASRSGAASIVVANRTRSHAERLAAGRARRPRSRLADLPAAMAAADVVISCTGAAGQVITAEHGRRPRVAGPGRGRQGPLVFLDLAMPRDVDPAVAGLPGRRADRHGPAQRARQTAARDDDVAAVRAIVEAELAAYRSAVDAARVAPTVVALRAKAAKVVDAELARLAGRLSCRRPERARPG